jgi:galacturan 1,4-alpha-galacturonidase
MYNAKNGARIKAFAGPGVGSGIVKNISFSFFTEGNVDNPLIVDQVCARLTICKRFVSCSNDV